MGLEEVGIHVARTAGRGDAEGRRGASVHDWEYPRKILQAQCGVACNYAWMESVTALSASCRRISLHLRGIDGGGRVDVYEAVVE